MKVYYCDRFVMPLPAAALPDELAPERTAS